MVALKVAGTILAGTIMIAFDLFMIALPFLFLYAIYRVIKGLMTHNAKIKQQQNNDRWNNPESK